MGGAGTPKQSCTCSSAGLWSLQLVKGLSRGQRSELLGNSRDKLVMLEVAGRGENHVAAAKAAYVVVEELPLIQPPNGRGGTQDRLAERMILPEILGKELMHQHVRIIFVDLDLLEDDPALALNLR